MKFPEDPLAPFIPGVSPYSLDPETKSRFLNSRLTALENHHRSGCAPYARLMDYWSERGGAELESRLHLPVTLFKEYDLISVDSDVTAVRSSSTTGSQFSRIYVDKKTKKRQALSAMRIFSDFIGPDKRPYMVFDTEKTVRVTGGMSARAAAVLSLSHFASDFFFVLKENDMGALEVDFDALASAIAQIGDTPFIAYGFTYILFQAHKEIARAIRSSFRAHPQTFLFHSGGWKKMVSLAVEKPVFNQSVAEVWGLGPENVVDFYGSVEQVGVPYPDCRHGYKHAPYWAEIVTRNADDMRPCANGETGLVQLVNALPLSAPNHNVLTEDLGRVILDDGCPCGRRGKAFEFIGRAPKAEIRGCSDVGAAV